MNAVILTVVGLIYSATTGQISQVQVDKGHPNMDSCLQHAANVIDMNHVVAIDCRWITVNQETWQITFGKKI